MFCTNCGTELQEDQRFCHKCGYKQDGQPNNNSIEKETLPNQTLVHKTNLEEEKEAQRETRKKRKTKIVKRIIVVLLLVLVFAGTGTLAGLWYFSPGQQIDRALSSEDFETAIETYKENQDRIDVQKLSVLLTEQIEMIWDDFQNGNIEYTAAIGKLQAIDSFGILEVEEILAKRLQDVKDLNGSRGAYSTAEAFMEEGDYYNAIVQYRMVIDSDANYGVSTQRLQEAINLYHGMVNAKVNSYDNSEEYRSAVEELEQALALLPDDVEFIQQFNSYQTKYTEKMKMDALEVASDHAANGDWINAMAVLSELAERIGKDDELQRTYESYQQQYVDGIIAEADIMIVSKDYTSAIALLNGAIKDIPNNTVLTDKLELVNSLKPVLLTELTPINGGFDWNYGSPTDTFGTTYSNAVNYFIKRDGGGSTSSKSDSAEYRLYGEYSVFTFGIAPHSELRENETGQIQIFADDQIIFTSPSINRKTDYEEYSLDVTNAEYLKIVISAGEWHSLIGHECLILMDCVLEK